MYSRKIQEDFDCRMTGNSFSSFIFDRVWGTVLFTFLFSLACAQDANRDRPATPDYKIQLDVISSGYNGIDTWFHPHAGIIPKKGTNEVVLTMQKWLISRSDVFFALSHLKSKDLGKTWSDPMANPKTLGRVSMANGLEMGLSDFSPKWHYKTKKLLGTGHTIPYKDNHHAKNERRYTAWSVYDDKKKCWSAWLPLKIPDSNMFYDAGAGSTQRVDLSNGDILLPIYFKARNASVYNATVLRCRFDGKKLSYVAHGNVLSHPTGRGFPEPSLTFYKHHFYLTLRNDSAAYVAVSKDGLHFSKPKIWRFDDGKDLGSYNTQQHWVTHNDGLFLVYTRRSTDNDNVVRHRAPLFIAQIDPERLVVIRASERVLVPNKGAQLGNFGVVNVNENETWVTTSEGMSERQPTKYGADGRVYAAKIIWMKPNHHWNKY
ncbi:sialidase family protein [Pedobacter heparinus]|uniref:sialidase family protein n=1 Tax=Pedobacter heparinus TaxID=984 RepID=UPI002930C13D|nr:sialidase family protein [Pedobacter heparinus]